MINNFDVHRLAAICELFTSDHLGERAAAASIASQIVRNAGLSWREILSSALPPTSPAAPPDDVLLDELIECLDELTKARADFVRGCAEFRGRLSEKQRQVIRDIHARHCGVTS